MLSRLHSVSGRLLLGGGLLFLGLISQAAPLRDDTAALVNGWTLPERSLDILLRVVQREDPDVDRRALLDGLIENRVLAEHALDEYGRDTLFGENRVGFPVDVRIENELVSTLRAGLPPESMQGAEGPDRHVTLMVKASADKAIRLLRGTPTGEHRLEERQRQAAAKIILARHDFPRRAAENITLADIYRRQNVQGRIALHRGDREWLEQEVRLLVSQHYLLFLAHQRSGLTERDISALRQVITDRHIKRALLAHLGVSVEIHQGNPALTRRAESITDAAVRDWYKTHRERFREARRANTWRILCDNRATCDRARQAVMDGMAFSEAARRWSLEAPTDEAEAGHLGWLERPENPLDWLASVAFAQPPGEVSTPIRHPRDGGEPRWSVLLVSDREFGYHGPESRTVAHVARREMAREQLVSEFLRLRERLLEQARIVRRSPS